MSASLVWELVRNSSAFIRKGLNGTVFAAEAGNLTNKNSFKYSGLAGSRTVDISVDNKTDVVTTTYGSAKTANKPRKHNKGSVVKKNARRALKGTGKGVAYFRPDLKAAALARMSAIQKSLRVKKAASK